VAQEPEQAGRNRALAVPPAEEAWAAPAEEALEAPAEDALAAPAEDALAAPRDEAALGDGCSVPEEVPPPSGESEPPMKTNRFQWICYDDSLGLESLEVGSKAVRLACGEPREGLAPKMMVVRRDGRRLNV